MNKRKAGEDFYFLQKLFPLRNFSEINTCCVYPSARNSDRVPFGTGKAIGDMLNGKEFLFYDFEIFIQLKIFFDCIKNHGFKKTASDIMNSAPPELLEFLLLNNFESKFEEIKQNVRSEETFISRFFYWFNGFLVLKAVHFLSEKYYPRKSFNREMVAGFMNVSATASVSSILDAIRVKDFGNSNF